MKNEWHSDRRIISIYKREHELLLQMKLDMKVRSLADVIRKLVDHERQRNG